MFKTICPQCDGKGEYEYQPEKGDIYPVKCTVCGGSGEIKTEEEEEISVPLNKALFTLLYDQFDCPDIELDMDDERWVRYIVAGLIEKNENICPFKNYDCVRNCKSSTELCKEGSLKINCGIEPETIWRKFMI